MDHSFTSLTVGDLTLWHTHMDIVDGHCEDRVDLLLGADFQRRLHLWISNSAHTVIMQYPPQRSPDLQ